MTRRCRGCDQVVRSKRGARRPKLWCSEACRLRVFRSSHPEYRARQADLAAAAHRESYVPRSYQRFCVVCSSEFTAKHERRKYCSRKCSSTAYAAARRADGRAADLSAKRRALEVGAKIQGARRASVFERDGFVCHLCLGPTNPEAKYPEPDFPVIDHVVPLARGGEHVPSNWAVAHNLCNSRRRDLAIDEFRSLYLSRPTWADTVSRHGGHTMGGRGQVPKDQSLSRRTKGGTTLRVIEVEAMPQPELPTRYKTRDDEDGSFTDIIDWPTATVEWWNMWATSPLSTEFTQSDWEELKMAALLHAQFVEGDYKLAAELRLRTAKFGTTPEDRARLKIQFALADEAEDRSERRKSSKQPKPGSDPRLKLA